MSEQTDPRPDDRRTDDPREEQRRARAERVAKMQQADRRSAGRRRGAIIAGATVAVLAVAGGVTAVIVSQPDPPSLDAVQTFQYSNGEAHVTTPVDYAESPPVGGPHNGVPQTCGVYDTAVPNENAVHSLEHGAVWITYRPDLPADQVEALRADAQGQSYVLMSPYPDLPSPVVLSAWNNQLRLDSGEDPRIGAFLARFVQGSQTPEPGAACIGNGAPIA
ncbi:DUF3105 domain-containing protein [Kineococcus gynurae]|uniref:DUF3105 domain-containing protein n=1 Tax=Kineococcus gynurae TaxID=452979 RepID=A0ABV5LNB2_9ACTN